MQTSIRTYYVVKYMTVRDPFWQTFGGTKSAQELDSEQLKAAVEWLRQENKQRRFYLRYQVIKVTEEQTEAEELP